MEKDTSEAFNYTVEQYELACRQGFAQDNILYEQLIIHLRTTRYAPGIKDKRKKVLRRARHFQWYGRDQKLYKLDHDGKPRELVVRSFEEFAAVLEHYHSSPTGGHSSWVATQEKIASFSKCQHYTPMKTQAPEMHPIKVKEPWELVGVDMIGPLPVSDEGYRYIGTFVNLYTKFVDFFHLKDKTAYGMSRCIRPFVHRWGKPGRILSDQGCVLCASINDELCKSYGIQRSITSAYHPQTNGLAERTNKTPKTRLAKLCNETVSDWPNFLEEVAYSIRTQKAAEHRVYAFPIDVCS